VQTKLRIGTRGSKLALWQAAAVRDALAAAHGLPADAFEIAPIRTSGDRIQDRALDEVGGKGLFTKEIEEALLSGSIALAVHSAKDMQTFLPDGLMIGACLEREDVRDVLISKSGASLDALPKGARIGTASLRREALIRRVRPDVEIGLLRGNVPTRLKRVEEGRFAATLLAAAGLNRLGLEAHITEHLPIEIFPPACGQGALAVECRGDDFSTRDLLAAIDHPQTGLAVACERAFLAALDGSCRTPIAGYAKVSDGRLRFNGIILSHDGSESYDAAIEGAAAEATTLGRTAGEDIRRRAPAGFLQRLGIG
jgi:hydroxymethylbilane synthase